MTGVRVAVLAPVLPCAEESQRTRALAGSLQGIGCRVTVFGPPRFGPSPGAGLRPYPPPPTLSPAALEELDGAVGPEVEQHHALLDTFLRMASEATVDLVVDDTAHYLPLALAGMVAVPVLTLLRAAPTRWTGPAVAGTPAGLCRLLAVSDGVAAAWAHVAAVPVLRTAHDLLPSGP